jgi:hypothetical protein
MRDAGKNRLVLIAGACLIASTLLVFEFGSLHNAFRFFLAGVLFGTAILLIALSKWTGFK